MQWLARRLQIFGVHVHVGVRAPEKAIPIVNALCQYVPHFLALSASSPFWVGCDTGLASSRTKVFEGMPTAGLPYQLSGWDEFENYMETLISTQRDRERARGLVGHPPAPGLRHRRAAHLRRAADPRRDRRGRRAVAVPGRAVRHPARPRLHPADAGELGAAGEQVAGGPLRPGRRHRRRREGHRPAGAAGDPRPGRGPHPDGEAAGLRGRAAPTSSGCSPSAPPTSGSGRWPPRTGGDLDAVVDSLLGRDAGRPARGGAGRRLAGPVPGPADCAGGHAA